MVLLVYAPESFEHTHENEQFRDLCKHLKDSRVSKKDLCIFIKNYKMGVNSYGQDIYLDGLIIKRNAIIVVELKDYGGKIVIPEKGHWLSNGMTIKGGANDKTVLKQISNNRFTTKNELSRMCSFLASKLEHIAAMVVFHQEVTITNQLSKSTQGWLKIATDNDFCDKVEDIVITGLKMNNLEIKELIEKLNLDDNDLIQELSSVDSMEKAFENLEPVEDTNDDISDVIEPESSFGSLDGVYQSCNIKSISICRNLPDQFYSLQSVEDTPYQQLNQNNFQKAKYWAIQKAFEGTNYKIENVKSSSFLDVYTISRPQGQLTIEGHYKKSGVYTFQPRAQYEDWERLHTYLDDETSYPIEYTWSPHSYSLRSFHESVLEFCERLQIKITNVFRENYAVKYCLKTHNAYALIKISIRGYDVISSIQPSSTMGEEDEELRNLMELIKENGIL